MTTFQRKPPEVQAIQWDGTLEGAKKVRSFIEKIRSRVTTTVTSTTEAGGFAYTRLTFSPGFVGTREFERDYMMNTDWLLYHDDGSFEINLNEQFEKYYTPIEL